MNSTYIVPRPAAPLRILLIAASSSFNSIDVNTHSTARHIPQPPPHSRHWPLYACLLVCYDTLRDIDKHYSTRKYSTSLHSLAASRLANKANSYLHAATG